MHPSDARFAGLKGLASPEMASYTAEAPRGCPDVRRIAQSVTETHSLGPWGAGEEHSRQHRTREFDPGPSTQQNGHSEGWAWTKRSRHVAALRAEALPV